MLTYADVAVWADENKLGYYNAILSMMEESGMIPGYEAKTWDLYQGVGKDYGYTEELSDILDAFVKANGPQKILL